jgi:hypothetical protein
MLIEIEKGFIETVGVQPIQQARGLIGVQAGMTDKDLRHANAPRRDVL